MLIKTLKALPNYFFICLFLLCCHQSSFAGKLDVYWGYFNVSAETATAKGSASAPGAYKFSYITDFFLHNLELEIGYTLLMSNTFGGDLVYGVESGLFYYPLTTSSVFQGKTENATLTLNSLWRPFIGLSFHQRQAQSTNSGYAGFGVSFGFERALSYNFDFKFLLRHAFLSGPKASTAQETVGLIGVTIPFAMGK
ncbi:MAG: hypothetical protein KDD61_16545 [Bdellovibrionales bacterium]|nr:hypothetical protein [Bdellovibrionales bacterium]